jgi:hypothetical protein
MYMHIHAPTNIYLYIHAHILRNELVVEILLRVPDEVPVCTWAQRGVAFILQAPVS